MSSATQGVFYCDSAPNFYPDGDCDFPQVDDWWQSKYWWLQEGGGSPNISPSEMEIE